MSVRVRYAPSPTGTPHVGNVRTAIFNYLFARRNGGVFIARLEDTDRDPTRYKPETIADIEESLNFLGITPDEWWRSPGGQQDYVQSNRLELYQKASEDLLAGGFAYRCYCTPERLTQMREQQQARGVPSGYDRRCRYLSPEDRARNEAAGMPSTVRLAVPLEGKTTYHDLVYGEITVENKLVDDQVLLKSSGWPTYHLAVVVDDHANGITHAIRGEDWLPSTPKQVLLYKAFGWEPPIWAHAPLIVGADGKKFSKRHGDTQFPDFVEKGYLPETMLNFLVLLGWSAGDENRELFTKEELIERFSLEGISKSPARFDYEKLKWMNGEYIRSARPERLTELCLPALQKVGMASAEPDTAERARIAQICALATDRMKLLSDVVPLTEFFFVAPTEPDEKGRRKWLSSPQATVLLDAAVQTFGAVEGTLTLETAEQAVNTVAESLGLERGPVIHTTRLATTGRTVGPGLFELLVVLGKEEVVARLERAKGWVQVAEPV